MARAPKLPMVGAYTIPRGDLARPDPMRQARIARHLAWCELLHRERLAACVEPAARASADAAPRGSDVDAPRKHRKVPGYETVCFALVAAGFALTFACASLDAAPDDASISAQVFTLSPLGGRA